MLQIIRCYKEKSEDTRWIYAIYVWMKGQPYVLRTLKIPDIKNPRYVYENFRPCPLEKGISDEVDWQMDLEDSGFGEYEYYDPFKIRKKRRRGRPTKKDLSKQKMTQFKKSLIKREPKRPEAIN